MPNFQLFQVDAFTTTPLGGNPCAVIMEADTLTEKEMLMITREMNLSETAFAVASEKADFGARFYTNAGEIPFAGHPTMATVLALGAAGNFSFAPGETTREISLELSAGIIPVLLEKNSPEELRVTITQNTPEFLKTHDPARILPCFSLDEEDLMKDLPLQTVSTGTPQLMVPLKNHRSLRKITPRLEPFAELVETSDFESIHFFCLGGMTPKGRTAARHFSPPPEVLEDPFTGSATGSMGAYLWHYGVIDNPSFVAEQGHWLFRPGEALVEVQGTPEEITGINVGGAGVVVLEGELRL